MIQLDANGAVKNDLFLLLPRLIVAIGNCDFNLQVAGLLEITFESFQCLLLMQIDFSCL